MKHKIIVIHGPNLNLLGDREISIYGKHTLDEINDMMKRAAAEAGLELAFFQSNHEGEIVDKIGAARKEFQAIIINPAAYTHTSVAIRDALSAAAIPAIEVHLSNIYSREEFRHRSLTAPACLGQISGFGPQSYVLALHAARELLEKTGKDPHR